MNSLILLAVLFLSATAERPVAGDRPNIVYILCDDLGYGDVGAFNPQSKIATPNIDSLASAGMPFTDMHSGSAVCTPTRYGILTGRYAWRTRLNKGVLGGLSPHLIDAERLTVGSLLQEHGYHTACIGKWHLGVDWEVLPGKTISISSIETPDQVDSVRYDQGFTHGPTTRGFHHFFGISASLDMVPYTYLEGNRVRALPTAIKDFAMLFGTGERRTRRGPAAPDFEAVDVLPTLQREAIRYIESRAHDAKKGKPFFLYLPLASPHTPILPSKEWQGQSNLTPYADFVMQTDAAVGAVLEALDSADLTKETLVIVTSDNGFSPAADTSALAKVGHRPSYIYRGTKADIFEGGHRIPFVVRWPGKIPPGSSSDFPMCLTDLLATVAEILEVALPDNAGEDSVSMLPILTASGPPIGREALVHHSVNGTFAIRRGKWKLIFAPDSGGWSAPRPGTKEAAGLPSLQLYDLEHDPGETTNVVGAQPEVAERLTTLMERYLDEGRSTPGTPQTNDRMVEYRQGP